MSDSEQKPGFTVTDRRSVPEGDQAESAPSTPPSDVPAVEGPPKEPARPAGDRALPPADFSTFVLSLGSSALIHLGVIEPPGETGKRRDLSMAKHTIDLLTLLQTKTKSNLTPEEDSLLESLLYDLRLRYVEAVKAGS
jgi:hypothetical protein